MNPLVSDPTPPSKPVTVTDRAPVGADGDTEMLTTRCVELSRVTELTVIPLPEKTTCEAAHVPLAKLLPVMTISWLAAPRARELGLLD